MGFKGWQTPPEFFAALHAEFAFTLDAAASHDNALLDRYFTEEMDGLAQSWMGERVFCNPPYDASLYAWVRKASLREAAVTVMLLPASVDTAWFHDFIWCVPDAYPCNALGCENARARVDVRFLRGRLRFWRDGKPGGAPRAGNMIVVWR